MICNSPYVPVRSSSEDVIQTCWPMTLLFCRQPDSYGLVRCTKPPVQYSQEVTLASTPDGDGSIQVREVTGDLSPKWSIEGTWYEL